jgi:type II secretory pathway component PulF
MLNKISIAGQRRIFQSQLSALLQRGQPFVAAVSMIEGKASAPLRELILRAKAEGSETALLIDGLVAQGLLNPEMSVIGRSASSLKVDSEKFLRDHLKKEADSGRLETAILGPIHNVAWTFGIMFLFFLFTFSVYRLALFPLMFSGEDNGQMFEAFDSRKPLLLMLFAFLLLGLFSAFVTAIYLGLKVDRAVGWSKLRFLWKIPGLAGLFRKRITWRVFTSCRILLGAGLDQATAMETALKSTGLRTSGNDASRFFPQSYLLDGASVEAANLGSSLDTFPDQLETAVSLLELELPGAAESTARVIYYIGYVVMGIMVAAMLVQLYAPILRFSYFFD